MDPDFWWTRHVFLRFPAEICGNQVEIVRDVRVPLQKPSPLEYPRCKNTVNLHKTNTKGHGIVHLYIQMQVSKNRSKHHIMCVCVYIFMRLYLYCIHIVRSPVFRLYFTEKWLKLSILVHHVNKQSRLFRDENMNCHLFLRDEQP